MKKIPLKNQQFLLYCVIGASGVILDFGIYSLLVKAGLLDYQGANAVGYSSGTLLSFFLNAGLNFRVTDKIPLRLMSFFSIAFLGWLVSAGLLHWLVGRAGFDKYLSKFVTLFVVLCLQYNLNRLLSFRKAS